jgi:photosystem II stability/assembly factor-like uncharacterized protein
MISPNLIKSASAMLLMLACLASACAAEPAPGSTLNRPALAISKPGNAAMFGIATTGQRLVAVGERGIIALSDDDGKTWRQAPSPVSVSLTSVRFIDASHGWAAGHRGVVLHTADGGLHWERQLDGGMIAASMLAYAQQLEQAPGDTARHNAVAARRMAADGADKPLFDLYFSDRQNGIVIGAYGLALATRDGGRSWHPMLDRLDNPRGLHLYAIAGAGAAIYIAGEQGTLLRSLDHGASFGALPAPYRGSYFAVAALPSGAVLAAGLKGHAYRSTDGGASWRKLDIPGAASFTAFTLDGRGKLLLASQNGQVLGSGDEGATFAPEAVIRAPLSALATGPGGALTGVGLMGAIPIAAPNPQK